MTKHNCDRCGNDRCAGCNMGLCDSGSNYPASMPEPEVGDGFEFCGRNLATDANLATVDRSGWLGWKPVHTFRFDDEPHLYRFRRPLIQKSPARLETESRASNELSREFLLATIIELADAWDKCDGALVMKPDVGVPRFVSAMGVVNTIAFNQGKRV